MELAIIYHSIWGHMRTLAESFKEGAESVEGVNVSLYLAPETLPKRVLKKMHAVDQPDYPVATSDTLGEADAICFGISTRFGMVSAQMKSLMDSCGGLWSKGSLLGKPATIIFGTGTQSGGQETTALTTLPFLVHQGMIYVPMGSAFGKEFFDMDEIRGGSAYGAGYYSGSNGSRPVSDLEKRIAFHHGKHFASISLKFK